MKMFRFFDPKQEVNFVRYFPASLVLAAVIVIGAIAGGVFFGINWGIDFSGGTEMQIQFSKDVSADEIRSVLEKLGFEKHQVQRYGVPANHEMLVRVERLSTFAPADIKRIQDLMVKDFSTPEMKKDAIQVLFNSNLSDRITVRLPEPKLANPNDVQELSTALQAQTHRLAKVLEEQSGFHLRKTKKVGEEAEELSGAILRDEPENGLINYNVQFMGVSDKIAHALSREFGQAEIRRVEFVDGQVSQQLRTDGALAVFYAILAILIYIAIRFDVFFSPGAVVALLQDTFGAFLIFVIGRYEFDLPSVAALLTVVGVSINNTVVVYDRIRETLPRNRNNISDDEVEACVNKAVNDTLSRTINTTLTTLFTTVSLWVFAGGSIQSFAMALTVGLALGAFSSTYAAPATYLFMRKHFGHHEDLFSSNKKKGFSREERSKGIV